MFHVFLIDVKKLPEDDEDRSKHAGVTTNCVKCNFNISEFLGLKVWMYGKYCHLKAWGSVVVKALRY